jgi:hypothetical protein
MSDSGDVVRRITIQANGQGIDQTTDSVNKLGDAIDNTSSKAEDSQSLWVSMATGIVGVGAAAVGAVVGIKEFINFVGEQSAALADLSEHADIAAMSAKEFQETMFAAMSKGVSESDFTTGMDKIAADLVAASQGTTTFTKLLEANGMQIDKNASKAAQFKQAFGDIMTLMQNATPDVQQKLASIVGVSASWIPLLKESADQFAAQKQQAEDLGLVINDATIAKAKEFTDQWHTATATWDLQFKASLAEILPLLEKAASLASSMISGIGNAFNGVSELFTSPDQMNTHQLDDYINRVKSLRETVAGIGSGNTTTADGSDIGILEQLIGLPNGATLQDFDNLIDKLSALYDKSASRIKVTPSDQGNGTTKLPPTDDAANALTRAIDAANKNIQVNEAEAKAIGLSNAAQAEAKQYAELVATAQRAGIEVTDQYKDKFQDLAQDVGDAVDALNKAKVASDIQFNSGTAFLSSEDVKIATQLKSIYGNDITAALNSSEASAMRFNDAMSDINKQARSSATTFATDLVSGLRSGESAMESLQKAASNLSNTLTNAAFTNLFSGNWIMAGIDAVGAIGAGIFGGDGGAAQKKQEQAQQAAQAQAQQEYQDGLARQMQFNDQAASAGIDTSTVAGQLQAFDIQANAQRAAEMKAGDEAIVELEKSLAAQRQDIVNQANQKVLQSYEDFLASIKTGALSDLSPQDQLAYAQGVFNNDIAGAKQGNQTDINAVTQDAQNLLTIAQSFFASSTGYSDVYAQVTAAIQSLINQGSLYTASPDTGATTATDFNPNTWSNYSNLVVQNGGYADGGVITNGLHGVDSVFAHVAGGEFMTKASSVNPSTLSALQYINSTGRVPKQSGGNDDVVRVLTQGFNGQTDAIVGEIRTLTARVQSLEDTTRKASSQRRVPGSDKRAA